MMLKISCPKCHKGEKAELIEVQPHRRYTFKCPDCQIFFDLTAAEGKEHEAVQAFPIRLRGHEQKDDRRIHVRFSVPGEVIASFRNGTIKNGKVKDISLGGLSFEHTGPVNDEVTEDKQLIKDLSLSVNTFSLVQMTCKTVYDISIGFREESPGPIPQASVWRCGVQFEKLRDDQAKQLNLILQTHTKNTALSWSKTIE